MSTSHDRIVDEALAQLSREQAPGRDLWPAIALAMQGDGPAANSVERASRSPWPTAMAASLALAALLGALTWSVWHSAAPPLLATGPLPGNATAARPVSFGLPQDAGYLAARATLERTFAERLTMLAPPTRARVQSDLEIIRKANADIRDALAQDPASPLLLQLLRSTWQQEINLYTTVAHATDTLLMRRS
jgi:hypothetical protein